MNAGDWIALIGVVITIFLGTFVVNAQTKNRTLRDFFINEISALKNEYSEFIKNLLGDKVSASQIRDQFKLFSDKIRILQEIIKEEYAVHTILDEVFEKHGKLQVEAAGFLSIEDQYTKDFVILTEGEKTRVGVLFNPLHKSFMKLVVGVNKASSIMHCEKTDYFNT